MRARSLTAWGSYFYGLLMLLLVEAGFDLWLSGKSPDGSVQIGQLETWMLLGSLPLLLLSLRPHVKLDEQGVTLCGLLRTQRFAWTEITRVEIAPTGAPVEPGGGVVGAAVYVYEMETLGRARGVRLILNNGGKAVELRALYKLGKRGLRRFCAGLARYAPESVELIDTRSGTPLR